MFYAGSIMKGFLLGLLGFIAVIVAMSLSEGASTGDALTGGAVALVIVIPLLLIGVLVWLIKVFSH